jgi:plasmid stabilization system protein ParE
MPLDSKTLLKKSIAKAIQSPGNLVVGAVSLAASAVLWNPLPLILWGLGATGWVSLAATGNRYIRQIEEEQRREAELKAEQEREVLRQKVEASLAENPIGGWVRAGVVPDYMVVYRRLAEIRGRVSKVLADRQDLDAVSKQGILDQLGYMLNAYLNFVRERIAYLQILTTIRPGADTPTVPSAPAAAPISGGTGTGGISATVDRRRGIQIQIQPFRPAGTPAPPFSPAQPLPSVEKRLAEVDEKVKQLQALAESEPATARTRQFHIGILEKQRDLLLECQKRDQCVVAQLGAFSDVFEVILGRVSASQFSATEVASYMGTVVEQVVETEKFVDSLRPAMDALLGGIPA